MSRSVLMVAVLGSGGGLATSFPMLLPELKNPRDISAALYVFALPDR